MTTVEKAWAAAMAASTWTRPAPLTAELDIGSAVSSMICSTWAGVRLGLAARINAATPAKLAEAADVPKKSRVAGFGVITDLRIDRFVATKASVHIDDVLIRNIEAPSDRGDLIGTQVAALECSDLALGRAQFEEEFLLVRSGTDLHEGPRA